MGDRATLEKIYAIMRRLLLIKLDGLNPIPRKGTTRRECYRALYEIQELLETRRYFGKHLPQTNADKIRQMSDEELATVIAWPYLVSPPWCSQHRTCPYISEDPTPCDKCALDWLKQEAET